MFVFLKSLFNEFGLINLTLHPLFSAETVDSLLITYFYSLAFTWGLILCQFFLFINILFYCVIIFGQHFGAVLACFLKCSINTFNISSALSHWVAGLQKLNPPDVIIYKTLRTNCLFLECVLIIWQFGEKTMIYLLVYFRNHCVNSLDTWSSLSDSLARKLSRRGMRPFRSYSTIPAICGTANKTNGERKRFSGRD